MKKIFTLLIALTLCLAFSSCAGEANAEGLNSEGFNSERFFTVNTNECTKIYVDKETRVMYMFVKMGYGGGLTVMVDENGKPLLWEGELQNGSL